jgi:DNA-binding MarR family transcriptional regulator
MTADAQLAQVRRFNRVVTQRVGALEDRYLARDRPLGEARLLWEIGTDGATVRALRDRLGLDAGYVSRLLGSLATAGFVELVPDPDDRRVRIARLTARGRRERIELDRRSDQLAGSLLAPLPPRQREQLVTAMAQIERLLGAALVDIGEISPQHPDARACIAAYFAELDHRFETGFDPARALGGVEGTMLVARLHGAPIGCGVLKPGPRRTAEIKRLWVAETARGLGVGRRILDELEHRARTAGVAVLRLDTNRALVEAIAMYHKAGYLEVPPFNDEPHAHHWFEKRLATTTQSRDETRSARRTRGHRRGARGRRARRAGAPRRARRELREPRGRRRAGVALRDPARRRRR